MLPGVHASPSQPLAVGSRATTGWELRHSQPSGLLQLGKPCMWRVWRVAQQLGVRAAATLAEPAAQHGGATHPHANGNITPLSRPLRPAASNAAAPSSPARSPPAPDQQPPPQPQAKPASRQQGQQQRQRASPARQARASDLRVVKGIGPKYEQLLLSQGLSSVQKLQTSYAVDFQADQDRFISHLQGKVGIKLRKHCQSIVAYLDGLRGQADAATLQAQRADRVTLCVEGNISAGKSTFLKILAQECVELQDIIEVVPEPVDEWQNVGAGSFNVLDAFYREPQRYAYTFQNYVFVTRLLQERRTCAGAAPLRLLERSVFSDRMVFVRAVHEAKWLSDMELDIYDSWFNPVVSSFPSLVPDGFIYLRASPGTCLARLKRRQRAEEGGVSLAYLEDLHAKHEQWLTAGAASPFQDRPHPPDAKLLVPRTVERPPAQPALHPPLWTPDSQDVPDALRGKVMYLPSCPELPHAIRNVPALILDCNDDMDLRGDLDRKREYAAQVKTYFHWVTKLRAQRQQQLLSAGAGGAALPDTQAALLQRLLVQGMPFLSQPEQLNIAGKLYGHGNSAVAQLERALQAA